MPLREFLLNLRGINPFHARARAGESPASLVKCSSDNARERFLCLLGQLSSRPSLFDLRHTRDEVRKPEKAIALMKMKLPRDVLFHHDLGLMVFRPRGILSEKRVDEIVAFLEKEEERAHREFDRFSDLSKLYGIRLSFDYVLRVSFHRLQSYSKRPPIKSAFYVTSEEAAQIVNIHTIMTDRSPLQVAMFRDLKSAAKWLGVSVKDLRIGE